MQLSLLVKLIYISIHSTQGFLLPHTLLFPLVQPLLGRLSLRGSGFLPKQQNNPQLTFKTTKE